jgi:hypothetical protein
MIRIIISSKLKWLQILTIIIDKAFDIIKTDKKDDIFAEFRFVDNSSFFFPSIELKYNPETQIWEPENFEDKRREIDNLLDQLSREVDN